MSAGKLSSYQKAFDSVDRKLLWYKLLRDGCSTTMVNALKAMYNSVQMCVKYKKNLISLLRIAELSKVILCLRYFLFSS